MIEGRDIIICGDDWGRHASTIQHIGKVLGRSNRILWVNSLPARHPHPSMRDAILLLEKIRSFVVQKHTLAPAGGTFSVLTPLVLPFYDCRLIRWLNKHLLRWQVMRKMHDLGMIRPLFFPINALSADIVGSLGESSCVTICLDDFSVYPGIVRVYASMEREVFERADACFFVSDVLLRKHRAHSAMSLFLPQGVDADHISGIPHGTEAEVCPWKKPVVGFAGLVASWVDLELIIECARRYAHVSFLVVGENRVHIDERMLPGNLYFAGEVPYQHLPHILQTFDVGLIPFVVNSLTVASNPLKLLDYFSLGIPVVSTDLPEVRRHGDLAYVATDRESFISLISDALAEHCAERIRRRKAVARALSWESVVEALSEVIEGIETRKGHRLLQVHTPGAVSAGGDEPQERPI
jgi:glycosyltransferase involved in cell wall biosynthesis